MDERGWIHSLTALVIFTSLVTSEVCYEMDEKEDSQTCSDSQNTVEKESQPVDMEEEVKEKPLPPKALSREESMDVGEGKKPPDSSHDTSSCDDEKHSTTIIDSTEKTGATKSKHLTEKEPVNFPSTIEGFGYTFIDGEMRNIKTNERFVFEVRKGDKDYNQKHYEALGEVITEEVYKLLESEVNLKKIELPIDKKQNEAGSFFFVSEDAFTNTDRLMIIIHGSGVVRAGQWSRRLIINDCLDSGTQLPFIRRSISEGYGVVILNTNRNTQVIEKKKCKIRGSSSPEQHAQYVWKHFITTAQARRIDIVAHSYGGVVTVELMKAHFEDFRKRVNKIAFTDSVHDLDLHKVPVTAKRWLTTHALNWISCTDPLNKPQKSKRGDVEKVSAGTQKHEETSWYAFNSIFEHFSSNKK